MPERGDAKLFKYKPGQFLTFRVPYNGGQIERSYSLSSASCSEPELTICVKRVDGGRGSNWFNDKLAVGARIEATKPAGNFVLRETDAPLFLIAGGSGITPCISMIKQALVETKRKVKLVYANRNAVSVIYQNQLDDLADRYSDRFTCLHWLDEESGFMAEPDVRAAAQDWEGSDCYICGPGPLMDMAESTLCDQFGEDAVVQTERFISPVDSVPTAQSPDLISSPRGATIGSFRVLLDGKEITVSFADGETLLEAALLAGIDMPNSCREGHCGSCMAALRSGKVTMDSTKALSKRNIERGYILACQSRPISSERVQVDFDL